MTGDLAIVVATRDRREILERTLAHLVRLPEAPDVMVVDNGSNDGTASLREILDLRNLTS